MNSYAHIKIVKKPLRLHSSRPTSSFSARTLEIWASELVGTLGHRLWPLPGHSSSRPRHPHGSSRLFPMRIWKFWRLTSTPGLTFQSWSSSSWGIFGTGASNFSLCGLRTIILLFFPSFFFVEQHPFSDITAIKSAPFTICLFFGHFLVKKFFRFLSISPVLLPFLRANFDWLSLGRTWYAHWDSNLFEMTIFLRLRLWVSLL